MNIKTIGEIIAIPVITVIVIAAIVGWKILEGTIKLYDGIKK